MRMEGGMPSTRFLRFRNHIPERGMPPTRFLGFETMLLEGCRPSTRLARFQNHVPERGHAVDAFSEVSKPYVPECGKSTTHFLGFETMFLKGGMPPTRFLRFRNHVQEFG